MNEDYRAAFSKVYNALFCHTEGFRGNKIDMVVIIKEILNCGLVDAKIAMDAFTAHTGSEVISTPAILGNLLQFVFEMDNGRIEVKRVSGGNLIIQINTEIIDWWKGIEK
jgi:hypothetical protein